MAFFLKPPHLTPKSNRFNGVHLIFGQFAASNLLNQRKIYGNISHIWSQCQVFKCFLRYPNCHVATNVVIGKCRGSLQAFSLVKKHQHRSMAPIFWVASHCDAPGGKKMNSLITKKNGLDIRKIQHIKAYTIHDYICIILYYCKVMYSELFFYTNASRTKSPPNRSPNQDDSFPCNS